MSEVFDAELLLLRNRFSKTLGYFSPCFNSILLPAHTVEAANGKTLRTIVHEKAHWTQFNASPWGQFLLLLYEWYVWLSEEILVHTRQASRRVDKPLSFFRVFCTFRGSNHVAVTRPGRGGQRPPKLSMARAMSASGEWNPNALRISSRSLVFRLSTLALDSPCATAA